MTPKKFKECFVITRQSYRQRITLTSLMLVFGTLSIFGQCADVFHAAWIGNLGQTATGVLWVWEKL